MLNLQFLGKLDRRLRQAKNRMDVAFGGISVILAGDFYQLPPVEEPALYINKKNYKQHEGEV